MSELRLFTQGGKELGFAKDASVTFSNASTEKRPAKFQDKGSTTLSFELKLPEDTEDTIRKVKHAFGQKCGRRKRLEAYDELIRLKGIAPLPIMCSLSEKEIRSIAAFEIRMSKEIFTL